MADGGIEIDVRVTPSLMVANVRALKEYDDDTSAVFDTTEQAFDLAYRTVKSIYDARDAAEADTTINDDARLVKVADFADKMM